MGRRGRHKGGMYFHIDGGERGRRGRNYYSSNEKESQKSFETSGERKKGKKFGHWESSIFRKRTTGSPSF